MQGVEISAGARSSCLAPRIAGPGSRQAAPASGPSPPRNRTAGPRPHPEASWQGLSCWSGRAFPVGECTRVGASLRCPPTVCDSGGVFQSQGWVTAGSWDVSPVGKDLCGYRLLPGCPLRIGRSDRVGGGHSPITGRATVPCPSMVPGWLVKVTGILQAGRTVKVCPNFQLFLRVWIWARHTGDPRDL